MATTVTKTIGASGRDYATINDFFAAVPADLVALDELWEGVIYPDSGNTITPPQAGFALGARTTDATRCVRLKCAPGASFKDHTNKLTNALRPNASNGILLTKSDYGQVFDIGIADVELEGLQIQHTAGQTTNYGVVFGKRLTLRDCVIQTVDRCMNGAQAGSEPRLYNSLLISSGSGGCRSTAGGTTTAIVKGCTFVANSTAGYPIRMEYRPLTIKDSAWFGMSAAPYGTSYTGSTNNATDQTSFPTNVTGTHSLTYANQFESNNIAGGTHDFRAKAGSNLIGAGVADADIATDIVGTTRLDPPTIGAWDYISSGPTATDLTVADLAHAHSLDAPALEPSGSASLTTADLTHAHAVDGVTLTVSGTAGSITVQAVKSWPGGALQAHVSGIKVFVNNETTGALVYSSASVTTNGSGDFTVSDAAIVAGDYSVRVVLPDGSRGEAKFTVA